MFSASLVSHIVLKVMIPVRRSRKAFVDISSERRAREQNVLNFKYRKMRESCSLCKSDKTVRPRRGKDALCAIDSNVSSGAVAHTANLQMIWP